MTVSTSHDTAPWEAIYCPLRESPRCSSYRLGKGHSMVLQHTDFTITYKPKRNTTGCMYASFAKAIYDTITNAFDHKCKSRRSSMGRMAYPFANAKSASAALLKGSL